MTEKVFSKEWSNWIFENIERGCSLEDIYAILYKQGFNKSDMINFTKKIQNFLCFQQSVRHVDQTH